MPVVTIDPGEYEKFELKTAPPDGFVMLRPLPFGMKLARRSKATRSMMRMPTSQKGNKRADQEIEIESMDEITTQVDFAYCVGEHNLTDKDGNLLDFNSPKSVAMTLKTLDPKVGSEIERLIGELNEDEDEESLEDFLAQSTGQYGNEITSLRTDGKDDQPTPLAEEVTS